MKRSSASASWSWAPGPRISRSFTKGKSATSARVNYGGNNVTNDIVLGLKVTQDDAERLKERYGCAYEPLADPDRVIQLPSTAAQGDRMIDHAVARAHHPSAHGRNFRAGAARDQAPGSLKRLAPASW